MSYPLMRTAPIRAFSFSEVPQDMPSSVTLVQFLALFHETERAVRPDDNLVDKQTVQVGTDGGMVVRLDDAFEHVAVPAADGDGGLGADFFLPGERSDQHQILLDGLPGKRCIEQDSIAVEELVDEPGCIALRHLDVTPAVCQ
ncbi:hypothetical protein NXX23_18080 [Bacteroides ovatus]|nr:hypothetical protein [Bacteroides ovatus]